MQKSGSNKNNVVIIHGWPCNSEYMKPIEQLLSLKYNVINVDLPGCGINPWSDSINNIHDIADLILPNLPEEAIYIGWSFGGLVTFSIAARFPKRVQRIIGIGTTPKFIEDVNWVGVPKPGFAKPFSDSALQVGFKEFFKGFINDEFSGELKTNADYLIVLEILKNSPHQELDVIIQGCDICDKTDLREEFKQINCKIDMIFGAKDPSVIFPEEVNNIKKLNANVTTHIMHEAKHMMFLTHKHEFNNILKQILL